MPLFYPPFVGFISLFFGVVLAVVLVVGFLASFVGFFVVVGFLSSFVGFFGVVGLLLSSFVLSSIITSDVLCTMYAIRSATKIVSFD